MSNSLKQTIRMQREKLTAMLGDEMHELALKCVNQLGNRQALESLLINTLPKLS